MHSIPTALIALFVFLFTVGGLALGRWIGARREHPSDEVTAALGIIKNAVLGLLGLILGFSFSLASSRYDVRRELVVQEANAIGTAYLRAELLDANVRPAYSSALRAYADTRLAHYEAGIDTERLGQADRQLATLQTRLWQLATKETRLHPDAPHTVVIQSLNELFDTTAARNAARLNEVPAPINVLLLVLLFVSSLFAGHSFGAARSRDVLSGVCFAALIAVVLFAVFDLDRPRRGFIRESQQPMLEQRASMND